MIANNSVLTVVDAMYSADRVNGSLPEVRTPQEGYGIMAERFLAVASSVAGAKKTVSVALEVMSEGDRDTFVDVCDRVYSASVQVADVALRMATAMQNIVAQLSLYEGQRAATTPLESLAETENEEE